MSEPYGTVILEVMHGLKNANGEHLYIYMYSIWVKMLFNKCEPSNGMWIEDSNKDNYKPTVWETWSQMYLQCTQMCLQNVLTLTECNFCVQLGAANPQVYCVCKLSIHSPDAIFMVLVKIFITIYKVTRNAIILLRFPQLNYASNVHMYL